MHQWASGEIFPGAGQRRNFAYPFQAADDAMQTDLILKPVLIFEGQISNLCCSLFSFL